jgi:hypothetical protein
LRYGDPVARVKGEIRDGKKVCVKCGVDKPLGEFSRTSDPCRKCHAAIKKARTVYVPVERHAAMCAGCGETFSADGRRRRYCSTTCLKSHNYWVSNMRRRALLASALVETFPRMEIFERDGWMCGICHDPIDPSLRHPDRRAASVDHIVPLARGGEHSRQNVQAAHWDCNSARGARPLEGVA